MKFTLEIDLGNDAMSTNNSIAEALNIVVSTLRWAPGIEAKVGDTRPIRDENGNLVGKWEVIA